MHGAQLSSRASSNSPLFLSELIKPIRVRRSVRNHSLERVGRPECSVVKTRKAVYPLIARPAIQDSIAHAKHEIRLDFVRHALVSRRPPVRIGIAFK